MKYLYLDDEIDSSLRAYTRQVAPEGGALSIEPAHPGAYNDQIESAMGEEYDGLILDLRLDLATSADGTRADYRAPTLAQEIRTRAAEDLLGESHRGRGEYPIALWSTDERLDQSYARDNTSHDLFDLLCVKEHLVSDSPDVPSEKKAPAVGRRLCSLVEGYRRIKALRTEIGPEEQFYRYLGFEAVPDFLDERLAQLVPFDSAPENRPAHEYARFIRREVLESAGPLLDRRTMAAQLGIDAERSDDFDLLLERVFGEAVYTGVFHEGWPRWWAEPVQDLTEKLAGTELRALAAPERVAILHGATALEGLHPAEPLVEGDGNEFWVVCRATDRGIDPRDGFVVDTGRRYPWQRDQYVSRYAVQQRLLTRRHLRLTITERERADALFA